MTQIHMSRTHVVAKVEMRPTFINFHYGPLGASGCPSRVEEMAANQLGGTQSQRRVIGAQR